MVRDDAENALSKHVNRRYHIITFEKKRKAVCNVSESVDRKNGGT